MTTATQEGFLDKLKSALQLVEALKSENDDYKENFEIISENYAQLREKNEVVKREYDVVCKEKEGLESDIGLMRDKVKARMVDKEKEIEALKSKPLNLKEIEKIKLELVAELERAQELKFKLIEGDCNKFRSLYYKVRREWDSAESENEIKISEYSRTNSLQKQANDDEVAKLICKLELLQQEVSDTSEIEKTRMLQREKIELELKTKMLLQEINTVREVKEDLRISSELEERNHKRLLASLSESSKVLEAEKDTLLLKFNAVNDENRCTLRRNSELEDQNNKLKLELERAGSRIEEHTHNSQTEISNMNLKILAVQSEYLNSNEDLQAQIVLLKGEKGTYEELVVDLRYKMTSIDRDNLEKTRIRKDEEWSKISNLQMEKASLEKQVAKLQQRDSELEIRNEALLSEQAHEKERLVKSIRDLTIDNELSQEKNSVLRVEREQLTATERQDKAKINESTVKIHDLQNSFDSAEKKLIVSGEESTAHLIKIQELENRVEAAAEFGSREVEAYKNAIEKRDLKIKQEKETLIQKIELLVVEKSNILDKNEMLESVIDKQQRLFEKKILSLKEMVKVSKMESLQLRDVVDSESRKNDERSKKKEGFLTFLNQVSISDQMSI